MGVKERKLREFKKREEEIINVAYELLTRLEPLQMTMEMIAERAEIGRGTIYKHFSSKDEIYARLIINRRSYFLKTLQNLKNTDNTTLKDIIEAYIEYAANDTEAYSVHKKCLNHYLKSNINENLVLIMQEQENQKIELIEFIMKKVLKELDLEPLNIKYLIYAGWGMLRGAMDFMLENQNSLIEDKKLFTEAIEQIFLKGIL